jgi:hypothetical protein
MKWITLEVGFAGVLGRTLWGHSSETPTSSGDAGVHHGPVENRFCRPVNFRIALFVRSFPPIADVLLNTRACHIDILYYIHALTSDQLSAAMRVLVCTDMSIARLWIAALTATIAIAADPDFKLGVDYSQRFGFGTPGASSKPAIGTDGTGALYLLDIGDPRALPVTAVLGSPAAMASYVMKLSQGGDRVIYLTVLEVRADALAVDSSGSVYVAGSGVIAKLNAMGSAFVYRMPVAEGLILDGLAVDSFGHAYVTGRDLTGSLNTTANALQRTAPRDNRSKGFVARVNTAGTGFDFATYLAGNGWDIPGAIAVDGSGASRCRRFEADLFHVRRRRVRGGAGRCRRSERECRCVSPER